MLFVLTRAPPHSAATQLRPEALNALKLPITVTVRRHATRLKVHASPASHALPDALSQAGLLGKLTLKVPWKRLGRCVLRRHHAGLELIACAAALYRPR